MQAKLGNMIGEELLLVTIFGDEGARAAVYRELDRRAAEGMPPTARRRAFIAAPERVRPTAA